MTVDCTASDAVAGLAQPSDAAFDARGNCVTAGPVGGHKVDLRAPEITLVAPAAGTYTLGEDVTASYGCTDGGSGVAGCAGPLPDGAVVPTDGVGSFTFAVRAADQVGNASGASTAYTVSYAVCPLFDTTRAKPAGSVVPVAVMLCDADGENVSSPDVAVTAVELVRVSDQVTAPVESVGDANPDSGFRHSDGLGAGGGYKYNLSTKGKSPGTWELGFTATGDPTVHTVRFQLK